MRTFILIALIVVVIAAGIAIYLVVTTPKVSATIRFPLTGAQQELMTRVPASADAFAYVPTAGLLTAKLQANPVTREPAEQWAAQQQLPGPWLLGGADVVAWKNDKRTSYAIRVDPFRAFLVRVWLMVSSDIEARWDGKAFIINGGSPERTLTAGELEPVYRLAQGLPEADMFVVQRESARGAFPPMSRPAVTSVRVTPAEILLVSRARTTQVDTRPAVTAKFPRGALIAATFAEPPRIIDDLRRLLRIDIAGLIADGGAIAIYDVDTGTLLPRPEGLVVIPADAARRETVRSITPTAELIGEVRDTGSELLVGFDRKSVPLYIEDEFDRGTWPATRWALRIDPARLVPILERAGDSPGLRIAAPRIHRAARDLRRWIRYLAAAEVIEAADTAAGGVEELRVRIASK